MVHTFSLDGYNIVVDVYSGAVHVLDDTAYKAVICLKYMDENQTLEALSKHCGRDEAEEVMKEIKSLIDQELLFSKDPYEDFAKGHEQPNVIKALCLHMAHDCNLRCEYCFASTGAFGGLRGLMPFEVAARAIDMILSRSGNRKHLEVDFFGGEPLLNFDVVKKTVDYAREREKDYDKTIRFTLTTNAVLLDQETRDFINSNIHNIVLSLDGRPGVNDRVRYRVDRSGTYSDILPRIKDMVDSRGQREHYIRGTFTRYNLDFAEDVLHLADLGFKQISVEPVVASLDKDYALRAEDLDDICSEYERLAREYIRRHKEGKGFNFFHFALDLDKGPCVAKRVKGCGAGDEYLAVTPEGDIYPCHQFVGNADFKLGNVIDSSLSDEKRLAFRNTNIFTKEKCKECWCKFYCSGGCAANAWQFNQDINTPYELGCELQKKRVECALYIKAALDES